MLKTIRDTNRLAEILRVLARHGFGAVLQEAKLSVRDLIGSAPPEPDESTKKLSLAERLRLVCEDLGPTFIKLAQILSTRPDLVPEDVRAEFEKLQDNVPPTPITEMDSLIEKELGSKREELFDHFADEPFAGASIGQVYEATLKSGIPVVVKVQRPGVERRVESDLEILRFVARQIEAHVDAAKELNLIGIADEFAKAITRELDYRREARSILRFGENFRENPDIYIPHAFVSHSSQRILTVEKLTGKKITELNGPVMLRRELAKRGARAILQQIFTDGVFHADPHPGNIFVLDGNRLAFIDFGMTGRLDMRGRERLADLLIAFNAQDTDALYRAFVRLVGDKEPSDPSAFHEELDELMDRCYGVSLKEVNFGMLLADLIRAARRYGVKIPAQFALMTKTLMTLERVTADLDPDFNLIEETKPFVRRLILTRFDPRRSVAGMTRAVLDLAELLRTFPNQARSILAKLQRDELAIQFKHTGLEEFFGELSRVSSRVSFALIICGLIVGSSVILSLKDDPGGFVLFSAVFGFIVAGILGIALAIGIIRSGKL
ncbi:MAG: ABC1 kinase family protein [Planctomycetota bacterium]